MGGQPESDGLPKRFTELFPDKFPAPPAFDAWKDLVSRYGFTPPPNASQRRATDVRYLYFIQFNDLVKVGIASDVKRRLETFRAGCPEGLVLRGRRRVPASLTRQVERQTHAALAEYATGREWFRTSFETARAAALPIIARSVNANRALERCGFFTWDGSRT